MSGVAARGLIAIAGLALTAVVVSMGAGQLLVGSAPQTAMLFAPYDGRIAAAAARAEVGAKTSPQDKAVRKLVRLALNRDATQPSAIELRALDNETGGDEAGAGRLFALSDLVSRRSLPTRLWLIQRAVNRGDVTGALEDFDIALRTSTNAPQVLFPVLARAAGDPRLVQPIATLLDRPSDWRLLFLNYAIGDGGAAPSMAEVVLHMHDRSFLATSHTGDNLTMTLANVQAFDAARRVEAAFHPDRHGLVRDPAFADASIQPPFGWILTEKGDAGAARGVADGRPALTYQSGPSDVGQAAQQLLTLAPGSYQLTTQTAVAPEDIQASPTWLLICAGTGGAQLATLDQPRAAGASATVTFSAPSANCPAQWLLLRLKITDGRETGAIAAVDITALTKGAAH